LREARVAVRQGLFGGEFFLFAFHAHLFQLALFGFDDFLLDGGNQATSR
jgi:hypothetical protein